MYLTFSRSSANIFLFFNEWQPINNFKRVNVISARKFCHKRRFADDLIAMNNVNFVENIQNIYSAESKLKKENQTNKTSDLGCHVNRVIIHKRCFPK